MNNLTRYRWLAGLILLLGTAVLIWVLPESRSVQRGRALYQYYCANCHGDEGEGLRRLIPPMHAREMTDPLRLVCAIRNGKRGPVIIGDMEYNGWMLPFRDMQADEIRDILNYVRFTFDPDFEGPELRLPEVMELMETCRPGI